MNLLNQRMCNTSSISNKCGCYCEWKLIGSPPNHNVNPPGGKQKDYQIDELFSMQKIYRLIVG